MRGWWTSVRSVLAPILGWGDGGCDEAREVGADVVQLLLRFGLERRELGAFFLYLVEGLLSLSCEVLHLRIEALKTDELFSQECVRERGAAWSRRSRRWH